MAFPSVRSATVTQGGAADTTATLNIPTPVEAGDTLFAIFRCAAAGAVGWPAGWTELTDESADGADDQQSMAWKKADGTEDGTGPTLTNGNGKYVNAVWCIRDAADPTVTPPSISSSATGAGTEPDSPSLSPSGGAKDYLWLTVFGMEGEQTGITAVPTNYTDVGSGAQFATSGTGGAVASNCCCGGTHRQANTATEDPGVWDITGTLDDWTAYTIAFHPAAPPVDVPPPPHVILQAVHRAGSF